MGQFVGTKDVMRKSLLGTGQRNNGSRLDLFERFTLAHQT